MVPDDLSTGNLDIPCTVGESDDVQDEKQTDKKVRSHRK